MTFWQSQFDKVLMLMLVLFFSVLSLFLWGNDKTSTFALQSASAALGCLLTLVTSRGRAAVDPTLSPTSATSTTTTTSTTETAAPPPAA
jgi:hypothetical protein